MLILATFCCLFVCGKAIDHFKLMHFQTASYSSYDYYHTDYWIQQKRDNFNPSNSFTWRQRYFKESKYSIPGGPVFLYIGGESAINRVWLQSGHFISMAKKFGAYCFMLEHRYYGKSHPTNDASSYNLAYLTSKQALADLANFIKYATSLYHLEGRKWIVYGGSYPGSLAVWARLKYPDLVYGAVSASAPLHLKVNFTDYMEVIGRAFATYGSSTCSQNVVTASEHVAENLKSQEGREYLQMLFKTCKPIGTEKWDSASFQHAIVSYIMAAVQYNENNMGYLGSDTSITVKLICEYMDNKRLGNPLHRYAALHNHIFSLHSYKCLDSTYEAELAALRKSSWDKVSSFRMWTYQTCNELGYFENTDSSNQPFRGFSLEFTLDQCKALFGIDANTVKQRVKDMNDYYGGLQIANVVTNVTLYNGGVDPWSSVSYVVRNERNSLSSNMHDSEHISTEFVPNTAHCATMYLKSYLDPPAITQARLKIENNVRQWLATTDSKPSH